MKKAILYLVAAVMLASIPAVDIMAERASHGDWYFREEVGGTQYSAYAAGNGKVHYKILIFATGKSRNFWAYSDENNVTQGSRCWTQLDGASDDDRPAFLIYEADNRGHNRPFGDGCEGVGCNPNDRGWVRLKVLSESIIVTNTYDGAPVHVSADGQWHEFYLKRMSTEDWLTYLEFDYFEPAAYAKKKYWVGNSVHYRREGDKPEDQARGVQTRRLTQLEGGNPDAAPQLQTPFLYVLNENGTTGFGKIAIPYVSVQQPYRYWINGEGDPIACSEIAGLFYMNSDDVARSFFVSMEVQRSTDTTQTIVLKSNTVNIPAYHKIRDFKVNSYRYRASSNLTFINERYKEISWKIYHSGEQDIMANDMFEIQRAYRSDFSDAETIQIIPMAYDSTQTDTLGVQTYTYLDTTDGAWWNPVENNNTIYYRVRRASSAQWDWVGHDYAASGKSISEKNYYPMPFNDKNSGGFYTKAEDFEQSRKLDITVRLLAKVKGDGDGSVNKPAYERFYWDDNQALRIRKIYKELQDTVYVEIPADSIKAAYERFKQSGYTEFNKVDYIEVHYTDVANTPCVHYEYSVSIDTTDVIVKQLYGSHEYTKDMPLTGDSIYFTEAANINTFRATKLTYSDYVLLTWEPTDGNVGVYKIETRPAGTTSAWTLLADSLTGSWYKDRTANPFKSAEWAYRLTMTYECNGNVMSVQKETVGSRSPYGKVSGRILFEDGIACAGIKVTASRVDTAVTVQTVFTDENGYYMLDSLLYGEGAEYAITPMSEWAKFTYNNTSAHFATITLNVEKCVAENIDFANISSVRVEGRVLYENSTVPVRDANFLVDGVLVKIGSNVLKTDASGKFEFTVPKGKFITIQAVKEGHTFKGDGFVRMPNDETLEEDSLISLTETLPGLHIWDQTKVRLIGRLTGGRIQADKTLGLGLSTNNLGDDLQMVFELEGDNISHIVSIPDDKTIERIDTVFRHDVRDGEKIDSVGATFVEYQKKRIIIRPDITTGEYFVDLFPVKYKITQATAKGYSTLYADGKTSETLDLTNAPLHHRTNTDEGKEVDYNESYSITYHSPITISCTQLRYGMEVGYYGEESINRMNIHNENINVPIAEKQEDGSYTYLFGAPVFNSETYQFRVTAHEDYYYNNDPSSPQHEEVRLQGATLKVYNGMYDAADTEIQTKELDAEGQTDITVPVNYVSFVKTDESALRVLDLSVEYEGAYVESQAIKAYVAGDKLKGQEFTASTHADVVLLDVLRDPPGSGSSAYIESGSNYSYSFSKNIKLNFGISLTLKYGAGTNFFMGAFAGMGGGMWTGTQTEVATSYATSLPLTASFVYKHDGTYTFTTSERIETGNDPLSVGASADVYIGATQNVLYGIMDAVQPLDSLTYATLAARSANNTMRLIAEGKDADGKKYYLVIGSELGADTYINSTFVYTQEYIEGTLLAQLLERRDALLMTGDSATMAKRLEVTCQPVYWSKVAPDDPNFGMAGYYEQLVPDDGKLHPDEVDAYNRQFTNWLSLLVKNEREKIDAIRGLNRQMVGTWSVGGSASVSHSETYNYSNSSACQTYYPGLTLNGSFGSGELASIGGQAPNMINMLEAACRQMTSAAEKPVEVAGKAPGATWQVLITPVLGIDWNRTPEITTKSRTKSTGFKLKVDDWAFGHMNVSVFRVVDKKSGFNADSKGERDYTGAADSLYGSYVYVLNGGATRCPWEGPDSTRFYTPKVELSSGTLKLENPKLDIDVHERSNVPVDQPAVFNLRLSNEGEMGYGSGNYAIPFTLKLAEGTNPKGARIVIDGAPLLEEGRVIRITRGDVITKLVQVYAGEGYDFENITLSLVSPCMMNTKGQCTFSVHYMPVACPVNISAPHDKWIMNTLSPQDSAGWYLPVVIDGFDVNYRNFDHIEFQYKLTTQSDEEWVNLCSYYASDSLYALASGNKEMITNGRIENIRFYGERDPMEQQYDLRAVAFCRHGNSYITRTSAVLTGIKDTRIPRVFGDPEPADAVLGVGDNLLLRFNEPIAGNYLDEDNNFQILGTTNKSGVAASTSLHFDGTDDSYAASLVERSLAYKSFSLDMIVKPAELGKEQIFFRHGSKGLVFGMDSENRLFVQWGQTVVRSQELTPIADFRRVVFTYDHKSFDVSFYSGSENMTSQPRVDFSQYVENAPLIFGQGFNGNMVEARLWTKALSAADISNTSDGGLTGYEQGLADYYPMNEGRGTACTDKASGANLVLHGTSWTLRQGLSMNFDGTTAIELDGTLLGRSAIQNETFMFWFKTANAKGTLFSANRVEGKGVAIEFQDGVLLLRSEERDWTIGDYADNDWHHLAVSVNRSFNTVNVYVDGAMTNTFAANLLSGVSGTMYAGSNGFKGHLDGFVFFEQALPKSLIANFDVMAPSGEEMGLIGYLPFCTEKENDNGILVTVFSPNDQRVIRDSQGNIINKEIPLVINNPMSVVEAMADKQEFAPIRECQHLSKLSFDWAFNGDELLINIHMPVSDINKQSVYVTVRDVEDLNGNPMASPVSWTAFVDKNALKWEKRTVTFTIDNNYSSDTYSIFIINNDGKTHQYKIENLPDWVSTDATSGTLMPLEEKQLEFKLTRRLAVGSYSQLVYLTDEDGLSEPLRVEMNVVAEPPYDGVDRTKYPYNMAICGQVLINGVYDSDDNDIVYAFFNNDCIGMANMVADQQLNSSQVYLTVYGNEDIERKPISFKLWQASTGRLFHLVPDRKMMYSQNTIVGCGDERPVVFTVSGNETQTISLVPGWNWISTKLKFLSDSLAALNVALTASEQWTEGDIIKSPAEGDFSSYSDSAAAFVGTLDTLNHRLMYMVYSATGKMMYLSGEPLDDADKKISLRGDGQWNVLPCYLDEITPITQALADYYDDATPGDIVKNYDHFAVFSQNKRWEGDLKTLRPGEGYFMYRRAVGTVSFNFYTVPSNAPAKANAQADANSQPSTLNAHRYPTNMTMIARIEGMNELTNERVNAYIGDELVGVASPVLTTNDERSMTNDQSPMTNGEALYFLTISYGHSGELRFETEDGTSLVPMTNDQSPMTIGYQPNAHHGSLKAPVILSPSLRERDGERLPYKIIDHDRVIIIRDGKTYNILGIPVTR